MTQFEILKASPRIARKRIVGQRNRRRFNALGPGGREPAEGPPGNIPNAVIAQVGKGQLVQLFDPGRQGFYPGIVQIQFSQQMQLGEIG